MPKGLALIIAERAKHEKKDDAEPADDGFDAAASEALGVSDPDRVAALKAAIKMCMDDSYDD